MSSPHDIRRLLGERAGFEVVDATPTETQIRIIGRVPPNASSHWVVIVHHLLVHTKATPWKVDISRQYFLRATPSGEKLFYAWRLIFQGSPKISAYMPDILQAIQSAPKPARVEFQEFPLTGAGAHRTQTINGKGAGPVDSMPLGPMAAMAALQSRVER